MPPFQSTAASGTLPMEHTNETTEITGPIKGPHNFASSGCEVRKNVCQKLSGTHAASAPANNSPMAMSFQMDTTSITKQWLMALRPAAEKILWISDPSVTD